MNAQFGIGIGIGIMIRGIDAYLDTPTSAPPRWLGRCAH